MREVTEGVEQEAIAAQPDLIPVLIRCEYEAQPNPVGFSKIGSW